MGVVPAERLEIEKIGMDVDSVSFDSGALG